MANIRGLASRTSDHRTIKPGLEYFKYNHNSAEERMGLVSEMAKLLPEHNLYGDFLNDKHYLGVLELLMASTLEPLHKEEIFFRSIIPKLIAHDNFLDIGVGNGDFTKKVGAKFSRTTVVDDSEEMLAMIPALINDELTNKIFGSITNHSLEIYHSSVKYDLILLSHTLYYIPENERFPLINKLYPLLSENGVVVIVYNEGGDREQIVEYFGAKGSGFAEINNKIPSKFDSVRLYQVDEFLDAGDIVPMMHLAGFALKDYGLTAHGEELRGYLSENYCPEGVCQIKMVQNIMIIGDLGDY